MSKDEHSIKSVVEQVIKEEVPRIIQQLAMGVRYPYLGALAQGCCADKGCCRVQGCCGDQGCCVKQKGVMELIADHPARLEAYIMSHKDEVMKFFKQRGVELNL